MEILCVLCSMGWAVALGCFFLLGGARKAHKDGTVVSDATFILLTLGFAIAVGSCAAEERVCEIAGLEADP